MSAFRESLPVFLRQNGTKFSKIFNLLQVFKKDYVFFQKEKGMYMFDQYYVSKLSFREDGHLIDSVYVYREKDGCLIDGAEHKRAWLVNRMSDFDFVYCAARGIDGRWRKSGEFVYENDLFHWGRELPQNIEQRNVFISFYHKNEKYKNYLESVLKDLSINQSVHDGDIKADNADEYIRHLIQEKHLKDTTVLIVLVGPNTKNRKHVDWEISGALNYKVGNRYAGILALHLPNHPDYGKKTYAPSLLPKRLLANLESGYAAIYDWTTDRCLLQQYIEDAFARRAYVDKIENKKIPLKDEDDVDVFWE